MNLQNLRDSYIKLIRPLDLSNIIFKNTVTVNSPLRINLSAGWNDTPPYCNEVKGHTLNASILLNKKFPIEVTIHKLNDDKFILKNMDINSSVTISSMNQLLDCQSPSAPFALQKASILASGLIPFDENYDLTSFLKNHGGFELTTSVKNIPIGSGLGTSSILIFSCIKAIYELCNIQISNEDLFHMTATTEQIMTTGGGYQDQIGACGKGLKFISFSPGIYPKIVYENIQLNDTIKKELNSKLVFIYTGNTRVAKDLLQTIMNSYINNNSDILDILKTIGVIATDMKNNLINSDLHAFAKNMIKSFDLNIKLNPSFTNHRIQEILSCLKSSIDGYMLSGAGNGGFLTLLLKNTVCKSDIQNILNLNFKNTDIKLYDFELYLD